MWAVLPTSSVPTTTLPAISPMRLGENRVCIDRVRATTHRANWCRGHIASCCCRRDRNAMAPDRAERCGFPWCRVVTGIARSIRVNILPRSGLLLKGHCVLVRRRSCWATRASPIKPAYSFGIIAIFLTWYSMYICQLEAWFARSITMKTTSQCKSSCRELLNQTKNVRATIF